MLSVAINVDVNSLTRDEPIKTTLITTKALKITSVKSVIKGSLLRLAFENMPVNIREWIRMLAKFAERSLNECKMCANIWFGRIKSEMKKMSESILNDCFWVELINYVHSKNLRMLLIASNNFTDLSKNKIFFLFVR